MAVYNPQGGDLNLPALINYDAPVGGNVVIDVVSGEVAHYYIAGTVDVDGQPAQRQVMALSFDEQDIPGLGIQRKVLGTVTSQGDGTFTLSTGSFQEPVLVISVDRYGQTWQPNTSYAIGDVVHPATPSQYKGFVYDCTNAGISGGEEPSWWVDTGSNATGTSGTATFTARQYYQPLCHGPVLPLLQEPEE